MPTKSNRMTLKDVKAGVTGYTVLALGPASYIEVNHFTSRPFLNRRTPHTFGMWARSRRHYEFLTRRLPLLRVSTQRTSLTDIGIEPCHYNRHQTFVTRRAAQRYLRECLKHNIDLPDHVKVSLKIFH